MLSNVNYYKLLGIDLSADDVSIRRAYRKRALECHPDKNPDNPSAAQLFHELSHALKILTDKKTRGDYNKILQARKNDELQKKQLKNERKKLKMDLERREKDVLHNTEPGEPCRPIFKSHTNIFLEQTGRIRSENFKLLKEEQLMMNEQHNRTLIESKQKCIDTTKRSIKVQWEVDKNDTCNNYTEDMLINIFKKYGDIKTFVKSKNPGSALVEFGSSEACEIAVAYERGQFRNPLKLTRITPPTTNIFK